MAFEIEYTHDAEIDVTKAIDYYAENVSLKVAKSFYKKLLAAEKTLKRTPFFQKIHNDFHRLPLKLFPFIIIYKIEKETIKIFRVFHTSQNPEEYP